MRTPNQIDQVTRQTSASPLDFKQCLDAYEKVIAGVGYASGISHGKIELLGWDIEYVSPNALLSAIDQLLVRRMNDFIPDNDKPLILDCGANIGIGVLNYKRQFPGARIIAFEPDPQFVPTLRRNLENNRAGDVRVVEAAAWIADGETKWYSEGSDGSRIIDSRDHIMDSFLIPTVDIGHYLDRDIDLLKLDIEGAEYDVVGHIRDRLQVVKNIIAECHMNQDNILQFARLLESLKTAGFELGINSFGHWTDLIRQPKIGPIHWSQYFLVSGWRVANASACQQETMLPYSDAQTLIDRISTQRRLDEVSEMYLASQKRLEEVTAMFLEYRYKSINLSERLDEQCRSMSWRITKPIRLLRDLVGRIF